MGVPTYYLTNFLLKPNSLSNFHCAHFFLNLGVTHTHKFYNCDVKVSQAEIHCWTYYERMPKSIEILTKFTQKPFYFSWSLQIHSDEAVRNGYLLAHSLVLANCTTKYRCYPTTRYVMKKYIIKNYTGGLPSAKVKLFIKRSY